MNGTLSWTPPTIAYRPETWADMRIIWGPDSCRLEYLGFLLLTGRIRANEWDDYFTVPRRNLEDVAQSVARTLAVAS